MAQYKEFQIVKLWKETHSLLKQIVEIHTQYQKDQFGSKAKRSTIVELVHELAKAELHRLATEKKND